MLQRFHPLRRFSLVSLLWNRYTIPSSAAWLANANPYSSTCHNMLSADDRLDACILPLTTDSYKGSSGRIGVLGGSERYTGAPYYAAMASLHVGVDLAFVFCAEEAAVPIKSYSPELMVAPVYSAKEFNAAKEEQEESLVNNMVSEVVSIMDKMHALVIGPGLGRCPLVMKATARIMQEAMSRNLLLVVDADGLFILTLEPYRHVFRDYEKVILTPNIMEYKRLVDANNGNLSEALSPRAIIVKKGQKDEIIQGGEPSLVCEEEGGLKRSGGIGDVLSGTLGAFLAWNEIMRSRDQVVDRTWSCWCACYLVKRSTKYAYDKKKRSMTAPDVLDSIWANVNDRTGSK